MGTMTSLVSARDNNRWVMDDVHGQSGYIDAMVFSGAGAKSSTPPAGALFVELASTANVYVKIGGTAAVPGSDVTDGSGSQLLAAGGKVLFPLNGAAAVGVASGAAAVVTLVYYS